MQPDVRSQNPPPETSQPAPTDAAPQAANKEPREFRLPHALEKVLAFKDVRAQQVGVKPEDVDRIEQG